MSPTAHSRTPRAKPVHRNEEYIEQAVPNRVQRELIPDACIVALGAWSILDRGGDILRGVLAELAEAKNKHGYPLVVGIGGGIKTRHTLRICEDLDIPTGVMSLLAGGPEEQMQRSVAAMLAPAGGVTMNRHSPLNYPLFLRKGCIPVVIGSPPYHYWEPPPRFSKFLDHGPDSGLLALAETLGARTLVYVKDVDGICTADPAVDPSAKLIRKVQVDELLDHGPATLPLERAALEFYRVCNRINDVRVVNGLKRGTILAALAGKSVGTLIYRRTK